MSEDTTMDDDALMDGWDALVSGRANSLDRLNSQDREVIEMLHTRAWSPTPRPSFTSNLHSRLTAGNPPNRTLAPAGPKPSHLGPLVLGRKVAVPRWQWTALAAVLVAALIASFGGRLADDRKAPTVQAPFSQGTTVASVIASPVGEVASCSADEQWQLDVGEAYVDPMMTEVLAALPSVQYATLQTLTRRETGSVIPDGYDLSGVSGIVVDIVVVGAVEATFREGAWATTVKSMRFTGTREVTPSMSLDLLRGDAVVYPVGALVDMSNALNGRNLEIARLVLHDVGELPGRVTDSITLNTVGRSEIDADRLLGSPTGFNVSFKYVAGQGSPDVPGAACRPGNSTLVSGIAQEPPIVGDPDDRPTYGGPFVWISPFVLAPPATPTT